MSADPRIVLITGGSRGLGREAALEVARQGDDVMLTYRSSPAQAQQVVEAIEALGRQAVALHLDVEQADSFPAFAETVRSTLREQWGRDQFDALLNNAGYGVNMPFVDTTEAQFDSMMRVHVKAPFFLTQALLPMLRDGGRVLNVSSGLARFCLPGHAAYGSAKAAVETLSRYMAKELGERGISVNAIAPGPLDSPMVHGIVPPDRMEAFLGNIPVGQLGDPAFVAQLVVLLAGDEARFVTGACWDVNGGLFMR